MDLLIELSELKVNVKEGLERVINNRDLYIRMLKKLPPNVEKLPVLPFMEQGDYENALANAHTLKGIMGNLSVTPLYTEYTEIVNLLRAGKNDEAKARTEALLPVQEEIISCINKYI